jgi:hypothetical protein
MIQIDIALMCYSKEISLITFSLGFGFSLIYAFSGGVSERILGLFLAFVSTMQLVEAALWARQTCDTTHKLISITGMILNHLQPIVLGLLAAFLATPRYPGLFWGILIVYATLISLYSLQYIKDDALKCTTPQCGNPHLVWNWNNLPYSDAMYLGFLGTMCAMAILGFPSKSLGLLFSGAAIISYGLSHVVYDRNVVGAMWCFFTAYVPVFLVASKSMS